MYMDTKELYLRPFDNGDLAMMTGWLHEDHVAKWFHNANNWLDEINQREGAFSWIHHFIMMDGATPVGFCQYYDCFDAGDLEDWYQVLKKGDTFSIDYCIGHKAYLGKGYGKVMIGLLTQMVASKACPRQIVVQPDKENHASNHVLMANGYAYDEGKEYYYKLLT